MRHTNSHPKTGSHPTGSIGSGSLAAGPATAGRPEHAPAPRTMAAHAQGVAVKAPAQPGALPPSDPALADSIVAPLPAIEAHLDAFLAQQPMPETLRAAVRYALLGGGKRLRPLLAWHACAALTGPTIAGTPALDSCGAVELVHAFSLVHDDLPAMDDDDVRRGRPTLHVHAGEAMAVLAGDAMLNLAFGILLSGRGSAPALAMLLARELTTGTAGMISGQVYDTLGGFASGLSEHQRVVMVHQNKTGALLRASCRMGALAGLDALGLLTPAGTPATGQAAAKLEAVTQYADAVGLMFQIVDDVLDITQTAEHAGKKTGKDLDAGKLTYPGVLGLDGSRAEIRRLEAQADKALDTLGPHGSALRQITAYLAVRTR
ncbi:MAG: hypothetical protein C0475_07195 [Planctomyces sp.]|nr:hypothetical protein [Planctomyces sp.]MBA4039446.1 hypothetical protein [Planctomyces sp.]MBA4119701.1 hypothetical protein [Isosphaera sp.]